MQTRAIVLDKKTIIDKGENRGFVGLTGKPVLRKLSLIFTVSVYI